MLAWDQDDDESCEELLHALVRGRNPIGNLGSLSKSMGCSIRQGRRNKDIGHTDPNNEK